VRTDRPRLAFIHNVENTFIEIDRNALSEAFELIDVYLKKDSPLSLSVIRAVVSSDIGFGWFASWHTFPFALFFALLRREFVLVIGGYDLAKMPEIGYGHQRGGLRKWVSRATMHLASALMTNSKFSRGEAKFNAGLNPDRIRIIYHGIPDRFGALPEKPSEMIILTVGNVDQTNLFRKGHEPFVRAARLLPDMQFRLVGAWLDDAIEYLKSIAPSNVRFLGRLSDEELDLNFREASVYVQASAHEGFGMSLAEGMLAGCIPIVSRAGALPEVVGDCGAYVDFPVKTENLAFAISRVVGNSVLTCKARQRVKEQFTLESREKGLNALMLRTFSSVASLGQTI